MMLTSLFCLVFALTASSYAREYNCTTDGSLCTGRRVQTITMNGVNMCCPLTASMSVTSNGCKCVETEAAMASSRCLEGPTACERGASFSMGADNVLRCCLAGFALRVSSTSVNGQQNEDCTCSPVGGMPGPLSSVLGLGGNGFNMPGLFPAVPTQGASNGGNATEEWRQVGQNWQNWAQQFGSGFRNWGQNMRNNLRNTGLDLARGLTGVLQTTLTSATVPVQRALSDVLGSLFRSIPQG